MAAGLEALVARPRNPASEGTGHAILKRPAAPPAEPEVVAVNSRFMHLLGATADEIVGRPLGELAARSARPEDVARLAEVLAANEIATVILNLAAGPVALIIQPISVTGDGPASHILVTEDTGPSDGQISLVIDHLLAAVFIVDVQPDGSFRYAMLNRRHEEQTGLIAADVIGRSPAEVLPPDDAASVLAHYRTCVKRRLPTTFQEVLHLPTGRRHWETRLVPITGGVAGSRVTRLFGSSIDISERVVAEQALRDSEQRFRSIFEHAGVGIGYAAVDGRIIDVNRTLENMLGYGRDELIDKSFKQFVHIDEISHVTGRFQELLSGRRATFQTERRFQRRDGTALWARTTASLVRDPLGRPKYIIGLFEDVTETRRARERIHYLASFDQVTGLPNLSLFSERVAAALEQSESAGRVAALLAISFDRLDPIRFAHSRSAAEHLMRRLVDRLRRALGPGDLVGRIGDDLFAVLLPDLADHEEALATVKSIIATFGTPIEADGQDFLLPPMIGVSLFPADATGPDELVRMAGAALQRARDLGTSRYELYSPDMETHAARQLSLESRLRRAIDADQFELLYQPKIEVETLKLTGFEALVRWRGEDGALISPGEFIPAAEETGLIIPLGELVLRDACRQMAEWRREGVVDVPVSVNLSGRQVSDPLLSRKALAILRDSGLPASHLKLELTETALFRSTPGIRDALLELHAAGVRFMLDDFGTGYSSLSYLKRFPIEAIKIDKSFVQSMVEDPDAASIVNAIINMAHALKMRVVAEGVETHEQLIFLRAYRCDRMQGFLFAPPTPVADIPALVRRLAV
ncbi:EAL domain-containing protein [Skermanella rosea]|uniref:putative bifunctional diguanylate cyclase/phosphodiesterase n=1 Tax=Skermanella rosea TaxID=1817965 RepID=UPI001933F402|nr:bifunctional diguanylate cyclase/phosphodiesterase [Skermanella rosea]UEM04649.1 EAL domain-containing protein [Skermanella rosea]